ncbi:MAG TPA: hypothetical protein VEI45_25060 [Mycobacterium sp.]|uniref:hypothetical protein n=1 Tax=Mycobacterium sp. TaxID=1785 RepID=UPI002D2F5333|nr:hypothetical protein [Mycobacterium sp.]HXY67549.1 hypothetical protein [Mycobacterium sp.]
MTSKADGVSQIAVPRSARGLSTLGRIDYQDAFLVDIDPGAYQTAEQWARAIFEDAPFDVRVGLVSGWLALGLKLDKSRSGRSVLGWHVRDSAPDYVLLGADSRIGMPGELLVKCEPDALLFATFVQHDNLIARGVWAAVEAKHVRTVRDVLNEASRRIQPATRKIR